MALSEEIPKFKKERLEVREIIKFQDNVSELTQIYERIIRELEKRIYKLENP